MWGCGTIKLIYWHIQGYYLFIFTNIFLIALPRPWVYKKVLLSKCSSTTFETYWLNSTPLFYSATHSLEIAIDLLYHIILNILLWEFFNYICHMSWLIYSSSLVKSAVGFSWRSLLSLWPLYNEKKKNTTFFLSCMIRW